MIGSYIFDLNGTVLADEYIYGEAYNAVLKSLGVKNGEDYPQIGGIGVEENWPLLIKKHKIETTKTPQELAMLTQKEFFKRFGEVELKPGLEEFLKHLKEMERSTALATSNSFEVVDKVFEEFPYLRELFDTVVTGDEVVRKKPSPDIFDMAADKLARDPSECIVFEDSASGVEAAHAAGMKVVALYRDEDHKEELSFADHLIADFEDLKNISLEGDS